MFKHCEASRSAGLSESLYVCHKVHEAFGVEGCRTYTVDATDLIGTLKV